MRYYCGICEETITKGEYQYSKDKFNKALCRAHQNEYQKKTKIKPETKRIMEMVKGRHKTDTMTKKLISIKDWIEADFETWDEELKEKDSHIVISTSKDDDNDKKRKYFTEMRRKARDEIKLRGKIGGGR